MNKYFQVLNKSLKKNGFSLIELLTSVGIIGVVSVVGIKSYQAQTNKSRTAEAKYSLSSLYTAEKVFFDTWNTYHENLILIGAIPDGAFHYDIGFGKSTVLSKTDGSLNDYPHPDTLTVRECTTFQQICGGDCLSKTPKVAGEQYTYFFYGDTKAGQAGSQRFNCRVTGNSYLKDYTSSNGADSSTFTALARGQLKNEDVWSVDQEKVFQHVTDGTQ